MVTVYTTSYTEVLAQGQVELSNHDTESVLIPQFLVKLNIYVASSPITESVLRQKYLADSLSMRQIASEFACSKTHVRNLLLKYKIPLRAPHKHGNMWYSYGKQKVRGRTIEHKAELRTIAAIKKMYSEGVGTRAIARFLDTMKIPTKQQGKGWHHHTITQILKREEVCVARHRGRGWASPSTPGQHAKL